ncbi:hypothetical protein NZL82_16810 [Sphingomonas sanguinis]|uniref:hypothetical protein n=1 Tax=Sphingomonas sp. LC-1 TaxID=3110957 RepID=UPI0021BABF51|nr:hypothetical protein [Sphingomonas sp. LC-1]MCT8003537.1 hypothetical protein [Sphingomonas sp. LC-1]
MIDVQQAEIANVPGAAPVAGPVVTIPRQCPPQAADGEIIVCGRKDNEQFRLRPIPAPPPDGLLSRPLRVQLAPGVSFGFQRGGGFGLRTEFGPGKKSGQEEE